MQWNSPVTIQAVGGTIGGTAAESTRGSEIDVRYADFATLFVDYVKGSEGTLYVYPKLLHASGGTAYQWEGWGTAAEGDVTPNTNRLKFTASASAYRTFDVRGISYMQIYSLPVGDDDGGLGLYMTLEGAE